VPKNRILIESRKVLKLLPENIVSLRIYFWTFPFSLIVTTFLIPLEINGAQELVKWLLIGVVGQLSMFPFAYYAKDRKKLSDQIALVLMMGLVRGAVIGLLVPLLQVNDPLPILQRAINSMVSVFYWFQIASITYEVRNAFQKKIKSWLEESILKKAYLNPPPYDANRSELITLISELQNKIITTLSGAPTKAKLEESAKEIDALVRNELRPLSKSQWQDGELVWIRAGVFRVLKRTLTVSPLYIWAVVFLTLPYSIVGQFNRYGLANTVVTQITWVLSAWLLQKFILRFIPASGHNYLKQNLFILGSVPFLITPVIFLVHTKWPGGVFTLSNSISAHIFSALSVTVVLLASSLVVALRDDEHEVLEYLANTLKENDLKNLVNSGVKASSDAQYAQYLHAEVQSQLLACKLLLLKSAESDFTLFSPETTNQIVQRLEKIQQPYEKPATRIPADRVAELTKSWAGLAEITHELPPELSVAIPQSDVISQLIEESIVNSVRHGRAKKIKVRATALPSQIQVVISDDGTFTPAKNGGGLGTILFNTFAPGWSISREDEETIIKFAVSTTS
jgi:lipid-A-disaccharide synthase-like uncharacterized protein